MSLKAIEQRPEKSDYSIAKEKIPGGDETVITTNCLYPQYRILPEGQQRSIDDTDGIRADLAFQLFETAANKNIRVVVAASRESSSDFFLALERFKGPNMQVIEHDTLGRAPARRAAFEVATALPDAQFIVYTQAEKFSTVDHLEKILQPIREGDSAISLARRNPLLGKATYPNYMWESEIRVNKTYDLLMRRCGLMTKDESFDWFFGIFAYRNTPDISALFQKRYELTGPIRSHTGVMPNPEIYSGNHYFPIMEGLLNKVGVFDMEIPFVYPEIQKLNETSPEKIATFIKRREEQAAAYRLEALHFLAFLKGNPRINILEVS